VIVHLRLQSPTQRRSVLIDRTEAAERAAELREEMGFPDDWIEGDAYDCAVSHEPVHTDYWRSLTEVQAELRQVRARVALLADQLRQAQATIVELSGGRDGLVA